MEYNTSSGSKRGYVITSALQSVSISLPVISVGNITKGQYGTSGNNRPLEYYKIGNGENILTVVFGVHGYEDAWAGDSEELAKIAKYLIEELAQDYFPAWTIYCIPTANPDGLLDGWTNNGPGRTTISTANDINRSFPANFSAYYDSRNFTGVSSLGSPEALALSEILLQWKSSTATMVLLDVHGWLNQTIGDYDVGKYYCNEFGFANSSLENSRGYLAHWGQLNGMLASLVELPFPSSLQDIITKDFAGKFTQATRNLLINILNTPIIPVTGVTVSPTSASLTYGETLQLTATVSPSDATNKAVNWSSSNPSIATVDLNGLVTAGQTDGSATITVETEDGNKTASATITVTSTSDYITYIQDDIIAGSPYDGWRVTQGFNDQTTNHKGHLGYDLVNNGQSLAIKPIFNGKIVYASNQNSTANGNIVVIEHNINGQKFYSSYSHLASDNTDLDEIVNMLESADYIDATTETTIGQMGGTGGSISLSPHLHLAVYTRDIFSTNPYGYAAADQTTPFEEAIVDYDETGNPIYYEYNGYYYDGPRSGGCVFYDPWGIISTNGQVITNYHP